MIPPERSTTKKRKPSPTTSYPSLPNDLILSCLARVSRLYYPTLSLVSKVPIPDSPRAKYSGLMAVGSNIYNIVGSSCYATNRPSSRFSILDCRSHTWSEAPSLPVKLTSVSSSVFDRKIYVAGRCKFGSGANSFKNSMQVFDTETQTWDPEPIPCSETIGELYDQTAFINGKLHVVTLGDHQRVVAYDSKEGRWDVVEPGGMGHYMYSDCCCEIGNVLYSGKDGLKWYDTKVSKWRKLKGLVGVPEFPHYAKVRLADYGGKLAVLWQEIWPVTPSCLDIVSCAVIELERRKSGAIWGNVEWCDQVLRRNGYEVVKVLAATV